MKTLLAFVFFAASAFGSDCLNGQGPLQDGQDRCYPQFDFYSLGMTGATYENLYVVYFSCTITEDAEEQGTTKCPSMGLAAWDADDKVKELASRRWDLSLSVHDCPSSNAALIWIDGPAEIAWPHELNFKVESECDFAPWIYRRSNIDGSFVGLRIDKEGRFNVEQSPLEPLPMKAQPLEKK